jgi:choline dehydrogenase-like flavoprotein
MLRDLAAVARKAPDLTADVVVVGAGIAGLLLATRLSRSGRRVVVLESGGLTQPEETHALNEVEQVAETYEGARSGRFRCLGGTSTRWGGAMLPFRPADFTVRPPGWEAAWPIGLETLTRYLGEIEQMFGFGDAPYDFPELMSQGFLARRAKWPPFRLRNVAALLEKQIASPRGPEVWLNATVTGFAFDPAGKLASVSAANPQGGCVTVAAPETVVAAGAIESTRLLLLADRQGDNRIFAPDGVLGRYFYDHLSARTATLFNLRRKALNRVIGFSFEGATMRNLRFEPEADLRAAEGAPAGFVHIKPEPMRPGGFDALRELFRKLQMRRSPGAADIAALVRTAPWIARAVWWRYREKRLLFPDAADFQVHVVTEQEPVYGNRIALSDRRVDALGCPLAAIDWKVSERDAAATLTTTKAFLAAWNGSPLGKLAEMRLDMPGDLRSALALGGGIYHPGGSVRMGADPRQGVLDGDLATFRVANLSVISTAAFPTGGGANPTMMLMMAALRAADRIGARLGR